MTALIHSEAKELPGVIVCGKNYAKHGKADARKQSSSKIPRCDVHASWVYETVQLPAVFNAG